MEIAMKCTLVMKYCFRKLKIDSKHSFQMKYYYRFFSKSVRYVTPPVPPCENYISGQSLIYPAPYPL